MLLRQMSKNPSTKLEKDIDSVISHNPTELLKKQLLKLLEPEQEKQLFRKFE